MIDKIITYSVRNPLTIGALTLLMAIAGGYSLKNLPIDAVPDVTNNQVDIITYTPSLASLEMEMFVTSPIEMAMSNIPGLVQTRSISKFGLSVVKLVFTDDTDIYWARQQVFERLQQIKNEIPQAAGEPYLGPVSTGLGEVYQYVIRPRDLKDKSFSPMELRTLQDWFIRKQLLGVPGVAEVSGFGGYKKEYQAKLKLDQMRSLGVTIEDVYKALAEGNSNTGGAYIEKENKAFTIRGIGLATSLEDIANTVVKNNGRVPVLVKDVAEVEFGSAIRYGAMTMNGQGEVVGGIIMMVKGGNGNEVIQRVKAKMAEIEKQLPPSLVIEPFIDRSKIVNNAIRTVATNLIEGALIVVAVIILFLGNWRASLLAASVIPLAMLFAFILMRYFGVVGNIMSLGAIDFGLLVDPAIIVVESVVLFLALAFQQRINFNGKSQEPTKLTYRERQEIVIQAASEVKKSVVFGGAIILIVYFPIMTLQGIEGKMFTPMAQTVSFAILGALLLAITYVPMMSALVLRPPKDPHDHGFSEKIVQAAYKLFKPLITLALKYKPATIVFAVGILAAGIGGFKIIGGEFVPKLQEGDLVVEMNLPVGTSMTESIKLATKVEKMLLEKFPDEVERVVSKIGTSEVPTDPQAMEAMETIVVLKPKEVWKKTKKQEELAEMVAEQMRRFPGLVLSIQQPIENRVNELMAGARTDIVVKLYGYDLDTLVKKSNEIIRLLRTIPGAVDVQESKIFGLPQINIKYDRRQMATYGITVEQMNRAIQIAFAGATAGLVYEKDKRFDLTLRLSDADRVRPENIKNLLIESKDGNPVPLKELADIQENIGPSEIGHENLGRRANIGFNVRGRDIESLVYEAIDKINKNVVLPPGYRLEFGGEFENLRRAKERLGIVVPIALSIIFGLLFASFGNVRDSLLIYAVVPLSAVGGVFSLLLRDMNFSISAGVGFIALFGIAVLNGILLVSHFNQLVRRGMSAEDAVIKGLQERFRPVLMTSAVAALGFLPMALSTSVGAEVQKPLATVVIGGLFTATILTLIVLPVLYSIVNKNRTKNISPEADEEIEHVHINTKVLTVTLFLVIFGGIAQAQAPLFRNAVTLSMEEAVSLALAKNPEIRQADYRIEQQQLLKPAAFNVSNLDLLFEAPTGEDLRPGLLQTFEFPTVYAFQAQAQQRRVALAKAEKDITINGLVFRTKVTFNELQFLLAKYLLLTRQDTIYDDILRINEVRYRVGQISNLERINGESQYKRIQYNLKQAEAELRGGRAMLAALLGRAGDTTLLPDKPLAKLPDLGILYASDTLAFATNPILNYNLRNVSLQQSLLRIERNKLLPGLQVGFLNQGTPGSEVMGGTPMASRFRLGLTLPFGLWSYKANIKAARKGVIISQLQAQITNLQLSAEYAKAVALYRQAKENLNYFETVGLREAQEIVRDARTSYRLGSITYYQYLQNLELAFQIEMNYLTTLRDYNYSIIYLKYLRGEQ
ncbi:MAG: CusA/CzcA family heavy metal efflux RND transporter [Cytophagales bacterium]|nr:CusA/CzcA family heavy metal efflux RND transporter [Bernardetiaceae bacterium]MDW8210270.1 CusA/CzcA family heavy metal efflux RND transporter [Cytophagales bacterium]